ncbi:MAG: Kinase inhibitor [Pseudomonadota bacterium]
MRLVPVGKPSVLIYHTWMMAGNSEIRISRLGDSALLMDAAGDRFCETRQAKIWTVATQILACEAVREAVPGMNNLMIVFDPLLSDSAALEQALALAWSEAEAEARQRPVIEVATVYGGPEGEDLGALAIIKTMTPQELVHLHASAIYTVAAVGAMPGFVYLSGLDPRLATQRRPSPRMSVAKGSVIIGGSQAGIMPVTAPSGWHILGQTQLDLFDPHRDPPALFQPGDRIRFVAERIIE